MGRVTEQEVKQIITTTMNVLPFIKAASIVVADRLSGADLSEETLKEIERWLSAHFLSVAQPQKKSQSIDGASETYAVPPVTNDGLKSTFYGQQALALDSSGTLANISKRPFVFDTIDLSLEYD